MASSRVLLKFNDLETAPVRKRLIGKGFFAERVVIEQNAPFDYRWSGSPDYLALHDLRLTEGETFVDGELSSRLCDLTDRMTFVPSGSAISGWSAPKKQANSFTAVYFRASDMSDELAEHYAACDLSPRVYFEDPALLSTLRKITDLVLHHGPQDQIYADSLGLTAVIELLRLQKIAPKPASVRKGGLSLAQQMILRDYIEDYLHTDISLSDLATLIGLTRFHFARAFAITFDEPPHRYVSRRRIEYAQQLLLDTDLAVSEVAAKVGLKNNTMLSRHMRKLVGVTPLEFRRRRSL
jgi:AraC family transcriptional regulator